MFCESCGQQFYGQESVCSYCGATVTRYWLQLVSLAILVIALGSNSLVAFQLLPRLVAGRQPSLLFRTWMWFNEKLFFYGWVAVTLALLTWAFWPRERHGLPKRVRAARWFLVLLLLAGIAVLLLPWIPAGVASDVRTVLESHPGLASTLAWGFIALVVGLLCLNAETRNALLGTGRALSLVSLGLLLLVLVMILLGWLAA